MHVGITNCWVFIFFLESTLWWLRSPKALLSVRIITSFFIPSISEILMNHIRKSLPNVYSVMPKESLLHSFQLSGSHYLSLNTHQSKFFSLRTRFQTVSDSFVSMSCLQSQFRHLQFQLDSVRSNYRATWLELVQSLQSCQTSKQCLCCKSSDFTRADNWISTDS